MRAVVSLGRLRPLLACLVLAAAFSSAQYAGSKPPPPDYSAGFAAIGTTDAKAWLGYLAGPECEGRGSGQPGFQKAAEFVAARFKEFGLKPLGDKGTYFQMVPFTRSRVNPDSSSLTLGDGLSIKALGFNALSQDASVESNLVFVRATGPDASLPEGTSFEGKIVVVAAHPQARRVRQQLFSARPAAIVTVVADRPAAGAWSARPATGSRSGGPGGRGGAGIVRADIGLVDAKAVARASGVADGYVSSSGEPSTEVSMEEGKVSAKLAAKVQSEEFGVPNVVAMLEGSDPVLKEEHIGIGAHLDHLGNNNGTIYWGADDDGSGSTALLLVAKAMTSNPVKPKRSIVFMAFCGEEMGLIGSRFYAANPKFPLEKMICELQMDMVGRDSEGRQNNDANRVDIRAENVDTIRLVGSKRISTQLHEAVLEANAHLNFKFKYDGEDVYTRSDHYSFASKGVPIAFLFTGFHPDYHQPTDTIEKINFDKITNAAKLFYLVVQNASNRASAFVKDVAPGNGGGGTVEKKRAA